MVRLLVVLFCGLLPTLAIAAAIGVDKQVLLPDQEVRDLVEKNVAQKVAGRGWDTKVAKLTYQRGIKVSAGTRELELVSPKQWDGWGIAQMALIIRVGGRVERNIPIQVELSSQADMVVASRQLAGGTILESGDLALAKQDIAAAQGKYITALADAIGKKLRSPLRPNAPLRSDQIERVPIIKSGQLVTIVVENSALRITVNGRARASGAAGEVIMVQNLTSQKEIPAKVIDASTVQVGF